MYCIGQPSAGIIEQSNWFYLHNEVDCHRRPELFGWEGNDGSVRWKFWTCLASGEGQDLADSLEGCIN